MKIKTIFCLLISIIMIFTLAACKKSELNIDGDDTYTYTEMSSDTNSDISSVNNSIDMFEYNASEFRNHKSLDWETNEDGDSHIFYIKNASDVSIRSIAYRPNGYDVFKTLKINKIETNLDFIKIPTANLSNYELFDFIVINVDDNATILSEITLQNKRGIEIISKNDEFTFEYLK